VATRTTNAWNIELVAHAESVAVVRNLVSRFVENAGYGGPKADAVRLAVTEACTNAVLHAYGDRPGLLYVDAVLTDDDELLVGVRDEGRGIQPYDETRQNGFGVPLMVSLSDSMSVESTERGTTVCLSFQLERADG
jgi:anti-sigma regulatory factor (Ser/Thr protein kinase)